MNTNSIQPGPEIARLVHAARHEKEDHAVYREKKRKKKDDQSKSGLTEDVEDLMDHSHEQSDGLEELTVLPEPDEQGDDEINLDVLI